MEIFTCINKNINLKILLYFRLTLFGLFLSYGAQAQFITKGDALKISDRCYKITEDKLNRYGTIWWNEKIDLAKPVELSFILYLGNKDQYGADGIAFLFHNDLRGFDATGAVAGGLGYGYSAQNLNANVIKPSVAIEFDTYDNGAAYGDFHDDHTTVVYDGQVGSPEFPAIPINPGIRNVEDNTCHEYKITWDPEKQELKLFFDGKLRFTQKDDIINNVFKGQTVVYYGFSGSTGGMSNEQTICLLDPENKPMAQDDLANTEPAKPLTINVVQNDSHTRNETITLSGIVRSPQNGQTTVVGQQIIYTPNAGFIGSDTFTYEICESSSSKCYSRCTSATVTVTVACAAGLTPQPVPISAAGSTILCGNGSVALSVPERADVVYQWQKDGQNTGTNSSTLTVTEDGVYTVALSNSCGRAHSSNTVTITHATPPPAVTITAEGAITFCGSGRVVLSVPVQAGIAYQWKKDGQPIGVDAPTFTATVAGEYSLSLTNRCGTFAATNQVQIAEPTNLAAPAVTPGQRCGPGVVTLTASGGTNGEYRWYATEAAGTPLSGFTSSTFTTPTLQSNTTYYVAIARNGCESARMPVLAKILPLPTASAGNETTIGRGESTVLQASTGTTYSWQPTTGLSNPREANPTARPEETTTYTVTIANAEGCTTDAQVTVTVRQDLIIPTAISPNGDGVNETWEITNIHNFPTARIEIFNRWGSKIYDITGYRNTWNGTWKGSALPVGTYFYVITLDKGRKLTGPISLVH